MKYFEEELREYIDNLCETKKIPIDLRFGCFGDINKFYINDKYISLDCVAYYTEGTDDIKQFFHTYLTHLWESATQSNHRLAVYVKDILCMDGWTDVIVGGCLFEDDYC